MSYVGLLYSRTPSDDDVRSHVDGWWKTEPHVGPIVPPLIMER